MTAGASNSVGLLLNVGAVLCLYNNNNNDILVESRKFSTPHIQRFRLACMTP